MSLGIAQARKGNGESVKEPQDQLHREASETYGPALERLAKGFEADPEGRRDLLQEIHLALWQSFAGFEHRCSLRTWVYRVAHNVAASHVIKSRRLGVWTNLDTDEMGDVADHISVEEIAVRDQALERITALIQRLAPLERQVILLYLEGLDAGSIGEITGISSSNAATRVHRIKQTLARQFNQRRSS